MFASRFPSCIIKVHTSEPLHYEQANDLTPFLAVPVSSGALTGQQASKFMMSPALHHKVRIYKEKRRKKLEIDNDIGRISKQKK
jgi:hypothetical protein